MLKSVSSITNAIGALNYKGTWNASTNTPTITSSVGVKGDYYVVSVAGTTSIDGISSWGVGDWITFNGSVWQRVEGGADLNGVNVDFTGTASGPTYETSNAAAGLTIANNTISADGTDANISVLAQPKGTGGLRSNNGVTGYAAGAGGQVTQLTSKATAVTIDKPSGRITMNNAALGAGASETFLVNNSFVAATDTVLLASPAFGLSYRIECSTVGAGLFYIRVTNVTGGSLSEALAINFVVLRAALT